MLDQGAVLLPIQRYSQPDFGRFQFVQKRGKETRDPDLTKKLLASSINQSFTASQSMLCV